MDCALLHHDHPVGNRQKAVQIMCADDQSQAALPQLLHHFQQRLCRQRVQSCGRLIENEKPGPGGYGSGNADPPLLASAKQERGTFGEHLIRQPGAREGAADDVRPLYLRHAALRQAVFDILMDAVREQLGLRLLEYHSNSLPGLAVRRLRILMNDIAGCRLLQPGEQAQQSGLAASVNSAEHGQCACGDI